MGYDDIRAVKVSAGAVNYYSEGTTNALYTQKAFTTTLSELTITNDSDTDSLSFSFNGATVGGRLVPGESKDVNMSGRRSIFIRGTVGGGGYRMWGT